MKYSIQLQRFTSTGFYQEFIWLLNMMALRTGEGVYANNSQQIFGILAIFQPEDGYTRSLMFIIALGKIR